MREQAIHEAEAGLETRGVTRSPADLSTGSVRQGKQHTGGSRHSYDAQCRSRVHIVMEGFTSRAELIHDLRQYYPHANDSDPITVIYFEPISNTLSLFG